MPPKPSKARPQHIPDSRLAVDKPRGLAKGQFSEILKGSFFVGKDPTVPYKPWRRQVVTLKEREHTPPVTTRRSNLTPTRNPILQDSEEFEGRHRPASPHWQPSQEMERMNSKQYFLPSEVGRRTPSPFSRTQSSVFSQSPDTPQPAPSPSGRKSIPTPLSQTAKILSYSFALPYREKSLSPKPSEIPFKVLEVRRS